MARISKADHPIILRMIDNEFRKVSEVAAEYGCTTANLYALLGRLRRAGIKAAPPVDEVEAKEEAAPYTTTQKLPGAADLFGGVIAETATPAVLPFQPAATRKEPTDNPLTLAASPAAATRVTGAPDSPDISAVDTPKVTDLFKRGKGAARGGIGASLAKPGYGLAMRTAEGDENVTPFRSLEDLLSAIKPALRAAARSPEAVWFSIRQIDLSALEFDAA